MIAPWKKSYDQPRQHIKNQRHYFVNKSPSSQNYGLSSSHVWMWELYHKESWVLKNWCFWTVVLDKTLEGPLNCKEIKPVHPKGNQSWIFIRRTHAEAETPTLSPPDVKNWLIWKDPDGWERLKGGGEGGDRGWDGWMASLTWWTWVWASFGHWWWTENPGVLQSMGSEKVRHAWVTELNWKAFSVSCWLWKHLLWKKLSKCLKKCSHLARGQVNMADDAKHCSPIRSSFEVLVVCCGVGCCQGEELGPYCWPMLDAGIAIFSASHWFAEHTSQI